MLDKREFLDRRSAKTVDFVKRTLRRTQNAAFEKFTEEIGRIDPIGNFEAFKAFVSECKAKGVFDSGFQTYSFVGAESLLYGHIQSLVRYAGLAWDEKYLLSMPAIEHGISWHDKVYSHDFNHATCYISQGAYKAQTIRTLRPNMPHFIIGPYIHYACSYASEMPFRQFKENLGRTLLVFPAHTYELSSLSYEKSRFVATVEKLMDVRRCDSLVVCAYWHDVDDPLLDQLASIGARIVSAGFRQDPLFIRRLRALIELSDCTASNAIGTNIGYSLHLHKPFVFLSGGRATVRDHDKRYTDSESRLIKEAEEHIGKEFGEFYVTAGSNNALTSGQEEIFSTYWGGSARIKTPKDIRSIISLANMIFDYSGGLKKKHAAAVNAVIRDLGQNGDGHGLGLLMDALGR